MISALLLTDFYALRKDVEATAERVDEIRISAGLEQLEADLAVLEKKSADSSLWDDPSKAQEILLALTDVKEKIKLLNDFESQVRAYIEILLCDLSIHMLFTVLRSSYFR